MLPRKHLPGCGIQLSHVNLAQQRFTLAAAAVERRDSPSVELHYIDALDWLDLRSENSIHAVVTDPPYGLIEYHPDQLAKRHNGNGGIWRIPPSFDGATRQPLPRFTATCVPGPPLAGCHQSQPDALLPQCRHLNGLRGCTRVHMTVVLCERGPHGDRYGR